MDIFLHWAKNPDNRLKWATSNEGKLWFYFFQEYVSLSCQDIFYYSSKKIHEEKFSNPFIIKN